MFETDEFWMRAALSEAVEAERRGEIPVGACLVDANGNLLASAGNRSSTRG